MNIEVIQMKIKNFLSFFRLLGFQEKQRDREFFELTFQQNLKQKI